MANKTEIPEDFEISDRVLTWATKGNYNIDLLPDHLENFILTCQANGNKYINWDSAFMCAIRKNWARIYDRKNDTGKSTIRTQEIKKRLDVIEKRDIDENGYTHTLDH